MIVWLHNLRQSIMFYPEYLIRCHQCKTIQPEATGWDYQQCTTCHGYMYDNR